MDAERLREIEAAARAVASDDLRDDFQNGEDIVLRWDTNADDWRRLRRALAAPAVTETADLRARVADLESAGRMVVAAWLMPSIDHAMAFDGLVHALRDVIDAPVRALAGSTDTEEGSA